MRNVPAIKAYERFGFHRIGVMRRYERRGGRWGDGLLLELVVPEATSPEGRATAAAEGIGLVAARVTALPTILPMMLDFNRCEGIEVHEATLVPALEKLLGDPSIGGVWLIER